MSPYSFDPSNMVSVFRQMTLLQQGITFPNYITVQKATPRVTLVQRFVTRKIKNIEDLVLMLTKVFQSQPRVADLSKLSISEQIKLASTTDIYICVHGAALAFATYLPPKSLVIEIWPYEVIHQRHDGYLHWIRKFLPNIGLGHYPFQIKTFDGCNATHSIPSQCICLSHECQVHLLRNTINITIPLIPFENHCKKALKLWEGGRYDAPLDVEEYKRRLANIEFERSETNNFLMRPACI